ncbi:MAG: outer membrane protein transport protein [Ignavibacteriales bacterium]|nr:outer membrane protein transport protein [Ignavibacteriales bacterium]
MKIKKIIMFGLITVCLSNPIYSQNYNDAFRLSEQGYEYDAKTMSLGNSTIGSFGNFSSTLINPAGIGTIQKSILNFSFGTNSFTNSSNFFNTTTMADKSDNSTNQFSLVLPLPTRKGNAVLAFGYNQSRDFNSTLKFDGFNPNNNSMIQDLTDFNDDLAYELYLSYPTYDANDKYIHDETNISGRLNQSGTLNEEGSLNSWVMSGAWQASKNLYIGGTFNIISGNYKSNRTYLEDDTKNLYEGFLDPADSNTFGFRSFYLNDVIDWEVNGWDFRLGILYQMNKMLSFGATVKFPTSFTVREKYSIYGESEFENDIYYVDYPGDAYEYEISSPMELSGGVTASLPLLNVSASLKYVDYSQLEFTNGIERIDMDAKNKIINEVMESVVNFNFGAEFTLPYPAMKIRGGFIYNPSPYVGDGSEYDKKYFTAGLGLPLSPNLIIDFAYLHGWWNNFGDNYGNNLSRTYQDISLNKVVISLNYVFM